MSFWDTSPASPCMSVPLSTETVTLEGTTAVTALVGRLVTPELAADWLELLVDGLLLPPPVRMMTPATTAATATLATSAPSTSRPRERRAGGRIGAPGRAGPPGRA